MSYVGAEVDSLLGSDFARSAPSLANASQQAVRAAQAIRLVASKVDKLSAGGGGGAGRGGSGYPQILLGIEDTSVAAASTESVTTESTAALRITDFFVRDAVGDDFLLTEMKISRLDILAGSDPIPASMFRSSVQRPPIETPRLPAGTLLTIGAQNITGAAKRFNGCFVGHDLTRAHSGTC